jgi:hypothetical protein
MGVLAFSSYIKPGLTAKWISSASTSKTHAAFTKNPKHQTAIHTGHSIKIPRKPVNYERWFPSSLKTGTRSAIPLPKQGQQVSAMIESIASVE